MERSSRPTQGNVQLTVHETIIQEVDIKEEDSFVFSLFCFYDVTALCVCYSLWPLGFYLVYDCMIEMGNAYSLGVFVLFGLQVVFTCEVDVSDGCFEVRLSGLFISLSHLLFKSIIRLSMPDM
jgi:hypothetical protein